MIGHTGRGNYGHGLDVALSGLPGITVVAVADPDVAGRTAAQRRSGAAVAYADYRMMLEREKPELVVVAPRMTDQHHAMVRAALEVGAHVYCEKPFMRTLAEADEVLERAASTGRRIAVAHQMRLAPGVRSLRAEMLAGRLGRLTEIRAWGKQDRRAGGEDLIVLGTHVFDLVRLLAGDPLWCEAQVRQSGRAAGRGDIRPATEDIGPVIGDEIAASFGLPGGVLCRFFSRAGQAAVDGPWGLELIGTEGRARIALDFLPQVTIRDGADSTRAWRAVPGGDAAARPAAERGVGVANRRVVDDWLAAIAAGREPECSGRAATQALEMAHAVWAAGLAGSRVTLPLRDRRHPLGTAAGGPSGAEK